MLKLNKKEKELTIIDGIRNAAKEIKKWPKWKQDLCGIEGDYTITRLNADEIINNCDKFEKDEGGL